MNIIEEKISGRKLTLYIYSKESVPLVVLNSYEEKGKEILARCDELGCKLFNLLSISELDWENDLSPWNADDIVKEQGLFKGKADDYIEELLKK